MFVRATMLTILFEGWRSLDVDVDVRSQQFGDGLDWWEQTRNGKVRKPACPLPLQISGESDSWSEHVGRLISLC